jgi:hypothetical protein
MVRNHVEFHRRVSHTALCLYTGLQEHAQGKKIGVQSTEKRDWRSG